MLKYLLFSVCVAWLLALRAADAPSLADPLRIDAPEQERIDFTKGDGGLPAVAGLKTFTIFKADADAKDGIDYGWTYHHHPDLASWHGRLYAAWNSCERDEDTWPSHELYRSSADGEHWTAPQELFPQGVSTPLRMYFFHAPNGRMLAVAGLRTSHEPSLEKTKGALVAREIKADHELGPVYTLRLPPQPPETAPPLFEKAGDPGFVQACRQLLADHSFLEQQDYGYLLPLAERMRWNDPEKWEGDAALKKDAADFGKALCFFQRGAGEWVAIGKKGWVTISRDGGASWLQPVQPPSLVTGMGKVWGQRTADGRYALVYNPSKKVRQPLVVVTSVDGVAFAHMRAITPAALPPQKYPGKFKSLGASYTRGLSEWSSDGSWADAAQAMWVIYSVNKEEIWISRIPLSKAGE
jgi:hypothetical protein